MISYLRMVVVAVVLLGVGFLVCPQMPTGDPAVLVRDALLGDPGPFQASCVLVSNRRKERFSMEGPSHSVLESLQSSLPADTPDRREVLRAFEDAASGARYKLLIEGNDQIAGRSCITVRLKPPSKKDDWFQLWVDPATHFILAWRHWSHDGLLLSSMYVTRLGLC